MPSKEDLMRKLLFLKWCIYTKNGTMYRCWRFNEIKWTDGYWIYASCCWSKKTPKNYYSPAISRVIDYIYHGKNKTLTLNQLASLVNLTPKYLSALFHKETGQTLTVFIHKVLIEKAQNLLAHSDYSLGEISTYLNFSSQSYFISIFKRYTGITPGQYRKMHRQISW